MNHCNLSFEAVEWINGELLGDAHLQSRYLRAARFTYTSKHLEYAQYISTTLASFGIRQSGRVYEVYFKDPKYHAYSYRSRAYVELLPFRMDWYPEGKKEVSKRIVLTPLVCRQWYIGDGCLDRKRMSIRLYTNAFPVSDVKWLIEELDKIGILSTRQPSNNSIYVSVHSTKDFLSYIGKCPVECYKYKWAQANVL